MSYIELPKIPPTHILPDTFQPIPPFGPYIDPPINIPTVFPMPKQSKSDGSSTDYYKIPEGATDLIDLIEFKNMNFAIGNIFKACYRLGQKEGNDDLYDLRKILFFVQREIDRLGKTNTI